MVGIFIGDTAPSKIYVGGSEVASVWAGDTKVRPTIIPDYLCFTANTAGSTVQLTKTGSPAEVALETSTDGQTWNTYTIGDTITLSNIGDKIYFRNTSTTDTRFSIGAWDYYKFVLTGSISGSGDITYLLNKNGTTAVSDYCFYYLFGEVSSLISAPSLPAATLGKYCYMYMFYGTSLTMPPTLPATVLPISCYSRMFNSITTLVGLPAIPATIYGDACCDYMFAGCSNIKLSSTQTGEYQTAYRIPTTGTGSIGANSLRNMFLVTGGTFTGTPSVNTTYYTSNTVV